jgi:hypothetical protein
LEILNAGDRQSVEPTTRRSSIDDVPKYNEFRTGAEDGSDESSASKLDDEDRNDVERDVQGIVIQLQIIFKSLSSCLHLLCSIRIFHLDPNEFAF